MRRWLQFSLRSFLLVVSLLAIWLGAQYHHPRITANNVDQLHALVDARAQQTVKRSRRLDGYDEPPAVGRALS